MVSIQHAPDSIRERITRFVGKNQFGEPTWRVVLAQTVTRRFDGRLPVWPAGENKSHEMVRVYWDKECKHLRGWMEIPTNAHPERWEHGPHYIPKYPCKGWILERWMPPHIFGDRLTWESHRDQWGDPLMGPFPERGDYWMLDGPWEHLPDLSFLEGAIGQAEFDQRNRPKVFETALKLLIKEQQEDEEKAYQLWEAELAKYCKSEIDPIFKTVSLGAQRVRDEVQKSLGQTSHLGAGQQ